MISTVSTERLIQFLNHLKAKFQTNYQILLGKMNELEALKKQPVKMFSRADCLELCLGLSELENFSKKEDIEDYLNLKRNKQIAEIFECKDVISDFMNHIQLNLIIWICWNL
ncbi:MAG: hypothetical protein Kow0037_10620 [Calditrichia bacterium]